MRLSWEKVRKITLVLKILINSQRIPCLLDEFGKDQRVEGNHLSNVDWQGTNTNERRISNEN